MKPINLHSGLQTVALAVLFCGAVPIAAQQVIQPAYNSKEFQSYDHWKQHETAGLERSDWATFTPASSELLTPATECTDGLIPVDESYTGIPRNDDDSYGPIPLPFVFSFCNASYSEVYINTNGNLTFTAPFSLFSPQGFPISTPMVAGFWADVDTRDECSGIISYKLESNALIVSWNNVGYYAYNCNYLNSFQIIITDGASPLIGAGNTVQFRYGDMQWTTGAATTGYLDGFGGTGATVGFNSGNGVNFEQIGQFNQPGTAYDGPYGDPDGVDYLDRKCYLFAPTGTELATAICKPEIDVSISEYGYAIIAPEFVADAEASSCGFANASVEPTTLYCENIGPNTITLTVTDNDGNTTTCQTTVNVVDDQPPYVECQEFVPAFLNENGDAVLDPTTLVLIQSDNCGIVSYTADRVDFTCDDQGQFFEVTLTVADAGGNEASCIAYVYAYDALSPVALCKDIAISLDATGNATLDPSDVDNGSYDNCGIVSYQVYPNTFSCDDAGQTYAVTLTVVDLSGYESFCTSYVTIGGDGSDDDCDGVANACDICPGGDDSVDNNNDGIADCKQLLAYNAYSNAWHCSNNSQPKMVLCHNGTTLCVGFSALASHFAHGDWVGPCTSCEGEKNTASLAPGFRVAPNPSNNAVLVDLHDYIGKNLTLTLRDNLGRSLWEKSWENLGDDVIEIAFKEQGWGAGAYHLTLLSDGEQTTMRVVITE